MAYRIMLFISFTILAAPLEYHIKWLEPWVKDKATFLDAVWQPLISGTLFFYAVIVAVEALMHLATYPQIATRKAVQVIKVVGYALSIVPFLLYILRGPTEPLSGWWLTFQLYVAALSLLLAVLVHFYTARVETHLRETW